MNTRWMRCLYFCACIVPALQVPQRAQAGQASQAIEISFPASIRQEPLTGRVILVFSRTNEPEVRTQVDGPK